MKVAFAHDLLDIARAEIAALIYEQGLPVAAVCHGVTGLLNIKVSNGEYLIQGKPVTGERDRSPGWVHLAETENL